jgi:glycosidase
MQWTPAGGFTGGKPWLPYGDLSRNVRDQQAKDGRSMLSLYRKLLRVRRASKALTHGDYADVKDVPEQVFAFTRSFEGERTLSVLNFANDSVSFSLPDGLPTAETLAGTHGEPPASQQIDLAANEARLLRLA